jgi:FkbM family methyltransferase
MIKVFKSKNYKEYWNNFPKSTFELKMQENRQSSLRWMNDRFPEKMFLVFNKFLQNFKQKNNKITFFDVGAAEGCYSCQIIKYFENANIVSFEPEIPRLDVMIENINLYFDKHNKDKNNFDIKLYQKVVSDGSNEFETMRHWIHPFNGGGAGSSSIIKSDRPNRKSIDVKFDCVSLNDYVNEIEVVDLIKIDVEGAELNVLEGANKFLDFFKPIIFLEVHGHPQNGSITIEKVMNILENLETKYSYKLIEIHKAAGLGYYLLSPNKE